MCVCATELTAVQSTCMVPENDAVCVLSSETLSACILNAFSILCALLV